MCFGNWQADDAFGGINQHEWQCLHKQHSIPSRLHTFITDYIKPFGVHLKFLHPFNACGFSYSFAAVTCSDSVTKHIGCLPSQASAFHMASFPIANTPLGLIDQISVPTRSPAERELKFTRQHACLRCPWVTANFSFRQIETCFLYHYLISNILRCTYHFRSQNPQFASLIAMRNRLIRALGAVGLVSG